MANTDHTQAWLSLATHTLGVSWDDDVGAERLASACLLSALERDLNGDQVVGASSGVLVVGPVLGRAQEVLVLNVQEPLQGTIRFWKILGISAGQSSGEAAAQCTPGDGSVH